MKIICVCGGSYKSFYLNYFLKQKTCDLLVFNFGIIYDYNLLQNCKQNKMIEQELLLLHKRLNCVIVAGTKLRDKNNQFAFLIFDGKQIKMIAENKLVELKIKTKQIVVSKQGVTANCTANTQCKIVLSKQRLNVDATHCSRSKIYIFCDNSGITIIKNNKKERKFYKYSKICLK